MGHEPETQIVVPVPRIVVVAIRTAHVVRGVVPRPTAQHTTHQPVPLFFVHGARAQALVSTHFLPTAQQPTQLSNHTAGVFVLSIVEPLPAMGQAQVQAHLREVPIGQGQALAARVVAQAVGLEQALLQVERGVEQPARDGMAMQAREVVAHPPGRGRGARPGRERARR